MYSQQAPSQDRTPHFYDNDSVRAVGGSGKMLGFAITLCVVLVFFIYLLWQFISIKIHLSASLDTYYSSLGITVLFGDLMTSIDVMIIALSIILIVRILPIISAFAIYAKSKNYNSAESMLPFLTIIQVFGIIEGLAWAALTIYDVITYIRSGVNLFPPNAPSTYYLILIASIIMLISKIFQGFLIPGFISSVKRYIHTGDIALRQPNGLRFATIMIATANAVLFFFIFFQIVIRLGVDTFFRSFQYYWSIYLCLLSYTFSNMFFVSVINAFFRRISLGGSVAPVTPQSVGGSYSPFNTYSGGYAGMDQNAQPANPYAQGQNNPPYQNGFGQGQNNTPYQSGFGQGQNNTPYQSGFGQGQNPPPSQDGNTGSGFSDDYGDMFKFK